MNRAIKIIRKAMAIRAIRKDAAIRYRKSQAFCKRHGIDALAVLGLTPPTDKE